MKSYIVILTTTDSETVAKNIAKTLVRERLAACVQIVPKITSFYMWKGKINSEEEYLLLIKTKQQLFSEVQSRILNLHNYQLPELIALPIERGFDKYLTWIDDCTL